MPYMKADGTPGFPTLTLAGAVPVDVGVLAAGSYETVAASTTAVLGQQGASGDYLASLLIVPATTAAGAVTITDGPGGTAITVFAGGATTALTTLTPIPVPLGIVSTGGGWRVTTLGNVSAVAVGKFT